MKKILLFLTAILMLGSVTLERGFNVEKGATFAVYPSSF